MRNRFPLWLFSVSALSGACGDEGPLPGSSPWPAELVQKVESHRESPGYLNRMVLEPSPYLRAHARDPIDWRTWGEPALAEAKESDRPLFIVVGYAACHWCHELQAQVLTAPDLARMINSRTIPVLIDRELQPDLDGVYLRAQQALTGKAGWPVVALATWEGAPFWASGFLPLHDSSERPGLSGRLTEYLDRWASDRSPLLERATKLSADLRNSLERPGSGRLPPELFLAGLQSTLERADPTTGGRKGPLRAPQDLSLSLLHSGLSTPLAAEAEAHLHRTAEAIVTRGLHDTVDGGFFRYCTDPNWDLPHYEKMLLDQALLANQLLSAGATQDEPEWVNAGLGAIRFARQFLRTPEGTYLAGLDADSLDAQGHRVEGAYYAVGDRSGRKPPAATQSILVAENALFGMALLRASLLPGQAHLASEARQLGDLLLARAEDLSRGYHPQSGTALGPAILEDHAATLLFGLRLFEHTGELSYLHAVERLLPKVEAYYGLPDGGWARTKQANPIARERRPQEGAGPSGVSLIAEVYLKLGAIRHDPKALARAEAGLNASLIANQPAAFPWSLLAYRRARSPALQVVVAPAANHQGADLIETALDWPGNVAILPSDWEGTHKSALGDQPTAYVCGSGRCAPPVTNVTELIKTFTSFDPPN